MIVCCSISIFFSSVYQELRCSLLSLLGFHFPSGTSSVALTTTILAAFLLLVFVSYSAFDSSSYRSSLSYGLILSLSSPDSSSSFSWSLRLIIKVTAFFNLNGSFKRFSFISIAVSVLFYGIFSFSRFSIAYYLAMVRSIRSRCLARSTYSLLAINTDVSLNFSGSPNDLVFISSMAHDLNFLKASFSVNTFFLGYSSGSASSESSALATEEGKLVFILSLLLSSSKSL